jgi:hypothetical protein
MGRPSKYPEEFRREAVALALSAEDPRSWRKAVPWRACDPAPGDAGRVAGDKTPMENAIDGWSGWRLGRRSDDF